MPIIKSAKKRVRTAEKAAIRNSKTKRSLKTALKAFRSSVSAGTKASTSEAQSAIDIAAKKGLIHKNKAARQKAQLARAAKAAGTEAPTKKAAAKKPAASKAKAPAKAAKPAVKAAKKAVAKKPAAKK